MKRYNTDLAIDLANEIVLTREKKGLRQCDLARKMKTSQPSIARVENGSYLPSLVYMEKLADALNCKLEIKLKPIGTET